MADYDALAATALRLLKANGRKMQLKRRTGGTYNAATRSMSGGATATYDCWGVTVPVTKADNFFEPKEVIEGRVRAVIIDALTIGTEPLPGDLFLFDGADWTVVGCTPLSPAGTPVIYKMGVKR